MNILSGVVTPTSGFIELDGDRVAFSSTTQAREYGISIIHQELSLAPNLNVRDNIFMGRELRAPTGVDFAEEARQTRALINESRGRDRTFGSGGGSAPGSTADRRDRARALGKFSHPDHGRADVGAERDGSGGSIPSDKGTQQPRRLDCLHLASPRRGAADQRLRRGAARRRHNGDGD